MLALVGVLCLGQSVSATSVLQKSFSELVEDSDTILVGKVSSISYADEEGVPYTYILFEELQIVKGAYSDPTYTVSFVGGVGEDGATLQVAGMPEFVLGEQMVVFVQNNGVQAIPFTGIWQGIFRVDEEGNMLDHAHNKVIELPSQSQGVIHDGHELHQSVVQELKTDVDNAGFSLDDFVSAIESEIE